MKLLHTLFVKYCEGLQEILYFWKIFLEKLFLQQSQLIWKNLKASFNYFFEIGPNNKTTLFTKFIHQLLLNEFIAGAHSGSFWEIYILDQIINLISNYL